MRSFYTAPESYRYSSHDAAEITGRCPAWPGKGGQARMPTLQDPRAVGCWQQGHVPISQNGMSVEPWMFRTALVLLAINCINALLFWRVHRRHHSVGGRRLEAPDRTASGHGTAKPEVTLTGPLAPARSPLTTASALADRARTRPVMSTSDLSQPVRTAAAAGEYPDEDLHNRVRSQRTA